MSDEDNIGSGGDWGGTGSSGSSGTQFGGDSVTETSNQSWFSRIGNALTGMIFGLVLFALAFPLILWNEGRAVHRAQDLEEGQKNSETVAVDHVDPQFEGKLVYASGTATSDDVLRDPIFGITTKNALRLKRFAEMYQWKETETTDTKKKVGGGETTTKTYSYARTWSSEAIDSSQFRHPEGHQNPNHLTYPSAEFMAEVIHLGAFEIPELLKSSFQNWQTLTVTNESLADVPEDQQSHWKLANGGIYTGEQPDIPAVGDARITFEQVPSSPCGLVGVQTGKTFAPYTTKGGGHLFELRSGQTTKDNFFRELKADNDMATWVFRLVGFVMMFIGLSLVFRPMSVLADIVPFFGTLVGYGIGLLAFLLALPLSLITIAIGWMVYRPVLGISLIVVVVGLFVVLIRGISRSRASKTRLPPLPPLPPVAGH